MKIGLIGFGNAGSQLARVLHRKHLGLQAIYSRDAQKVEKAGKRMRIFYTNDLEEFPEDLDLYILAVPDSAIAEVAKQLSKLIKKKAVVHVSGSQPSTILAPYFKKYGVFYPLQTLTKGRRVKFKNIPICIEAKDEELKRQLLDLGRAISESVHFIDDEARAWLHVAAVMVNNFTNHLYTLAGKLTEDHDLSFDLLRPLILETAEKVQKLDPEKAQTGPAARGDQATIDKHLRKLAPYPDMLKVYQILSKSLKKETEP